MATLGLDEISTPKNSFGVLNKTFQDEEGHGT
jgi:hypothetical protein